MNGGQNILKIDWKIEKFGVYNRSEIRLKKWFFGFITVTGNAWCGCQLKKFGEIKGWKYFEWSAEGVFLKSFCAKNRQKFEKSAKIAVF